MTERSSGQDAADAVAHDIGSAFHLAKALTYLLFDPIDDDGLDAHERRATAEVAFQLERILGRTLELFEALEKGHHIIVKAEGER